MKIGIIGAGNIGGALTRRLTALGHEVCVANSRGPILADLAATGARPVTVRRGRDATRDLIVVTIPEKNIPAAQGPVRRRPGQRGGHRYRQLLPA